MRRMPKGDHDNYGCDNGKFSTGFVRLICPVIVDGFS